MHTDQQRLDEAAAGGPGVGRSAAPLIVLDRVSKSFAGAGSPAADTVNLAVDEGTFVAVIGASGAGKTTMLKAINRLMDADSGTIRVAGEDVMTVPPHALRRGIGYVFQGIGLFPHMTVAENIAVTPRLLAWPRSEIDARVLELLDLVRLPRGAASRFPAELSGGQQQRVGVARALAAKPRIMLMDEPFGALDPVTRDALGAEYRRLHEQMGLTTLMVTHDVLEAVLLADRIAVMRAGRIVADGTPEALLRNPPDEGVRALMDTPRRQTERVRALMADGASHAP